MSAWGAAEFTVQWFAILQWAQRMTPSTDRQYIPEKKQRAGLHPAQVRL